MKKIGFIIPGLKSGGAERVLSTLSLNMDSLYQQTIFTWDNEKDYEFNAKIVEVKTTNSRFLLKNIYILFKRVKEVRRYKKEYKIDTCISHLEGANIVNILSKSQEKTIITVHNYQSKERHGLYGMIFKVLIRLLYNRADEIVAVSKLIKDDLVKNFNIEESKVHVIYNPFDVESIQTKCTEYLESEYQSIFAKKVIINVGRLTEQKGQWNLIKAFSILSKMRDDVALVILGKGNLENELRDLVQKLNLNDVYFLGYHKNPFKFIANSSVFALTSLYEGFPMCLAESMACRTPIVSVDCISGPKEMLLNGTDLSSKINQVLIANNGILVPELSSKLTDNHIENEHKIFAQALNEILDNKSLKNQLVQSGLSKVAELNVDSILNDWYKLM